MSTPDYRSEASQFRALAAKSRDPRAVKRWLEMALEYDRLAGIQERALDAGVPQQTQPQAMQQQQSKTKDDQ